MTIEIRDGDVMRSLRAHHEDGKKVFPWGGGLAVLDPFAAPEVNAQSFTDLPLPDRLADVLRGRESRKVLWREVRAGWLSRVTKLAGPPHVAALEERMARLLDERLDRRLDLSRAIQEVFTQALIPSILADLTPRELAAVRRDQNDKLDRLMRHPQREGTLGERLASTVREMRTSRVVRRVLRDRARGRRPRQLDLADPIVDHLDALGMDRAVFTVTTVLTAIAGPPGAVAVCLLLEMLRRPEWTEKVREEIAAIPRDTFLKSPLRSAPLTHRFVKETLRLWTAPLVHTRVARQPIEVDGACLAEGEEFHLSAYFFHHDPQEWDDPETFDPDRWLPGETRGPAHPCAYAPFGWAPTSCIGAGLGTVELLLLAGLLTRRYRIEGVDLDGVEMIMASVALPVGFEGTIERTTT